MQRRRFLQMTLGGTLPLLLGCRGDHSAARIDSTQSSKTARPTDRPDGHVDSFEGGTHRDNVPFLRESDIELDQLVGTGLDGRRYTDLSLLSKDDLLIPTARFFVRSRYPDLLDQAKARKPWSIRVSGRVKEPRDIVLDELRSNVQPMGTFLMECSGNQREASFGMMSAASWQGIPFFEVLERARPVGEDSLIRVTGFDQYSTPSRNGHSTAGASWVFSRDQLQASGAFLAMGMNGSRLSKEHGFPVRLFVPGWYGCVCIKWVEEISLVDQDEIATSQMLEFAERTHQVGKPGLARDFAPAVVGLAAMPIRVEKWLVDGAICYRVVGIMWGGDRVTNRLQIRFRADEPYVPVDTCPRPANTQTWSWWAHKWVPSRPDEYEIRLQVDDSTLVSPRMRSGHYRRYVNISTA